MSIEQTDADPAGSLPQVEPQSEFEPSSGETLTSASHQSVTPPLQSPDPLVDALTKGASEPPTNAPSVPTRSTPRELSDPPGGGSTDGISSKLLRGGAIVLSKLVTGPVDAREKFEDPPVNQFAEYLSSCGFEVQTDEASDPQTVWKRIPEAIRGCQAAVVLMLRETDADSDLDAIVQTLKGCGVEIQKLLVYCRIGTKENGKAAAKCMEHSETFDVHENLPNMFIISLTVDARSLAAEFVGKLLGVLKAHWSSKGIGHIMQYEVGPNFQEFKECDWKQRNGLKMEFTWVLPDRMLKSDEYFAKIIGDGSYLQKLDDGVFSALLDQAKSGEDSLQDLLYRNHLGRRALIINNAEFQAGYGNDPRPESVVDCANLRDLLESLKYDVQSEWNLTADEIRSAVETFANVADQLDSCILVVMSHGTFGTVTGTDGKAVNVDDLLNPMRNGQGIKGKPRLVIFQACQIYRPPLEKSDTKTSRGDHAQLVTSRMYNGKPITIVEPTNDQCGMIVAHSTSPGDFAWRGGFGSRFIMALCATFYEFAHKEDVVSMITRINFIMTHGFKRPIKDDKTHQMQLPWWSMQADRKFFLVDTGPLMKPPDADAEEDKSKPSNEVSEE